MGRTVFVTGGAGYVGSHCCKAFSEAGWNVVVYDNLSRGWRDFVKWGPLIEGDIRDKRALTEALREVAPDAVAHFAALAYVGESIAKPDDYYGVNAFGALNILEAMRETSVSSIVFSSTCATYGLPIFSPLDEGHPQLPISPYGWSKLMVEKMLGDFDRAYGIRFMALRYFNAAGADPSGELGERHEPETHVIPLAIRGVSGDDFTFTIHGGDYDTRDGTAVRDYVHVSDLADAHLAALEHLAAGGASDKINLWNGVGNDGRRDSRCRGAHCRTAPAPGRMRREGDPLALVAEAAKAFKILNWQPRRSKIEQIIADAWRWHGSEMSTAEEAPICAA